MTDVLTVEQRRYCMSRIGGKDTKPELTVRRLVHSLGYRYRLHVKALPGSPDLVFPSRRKVIFVHGCFWHRHRCKYGQVTPGTRRQFWKTKLQGNADRDSRNRSELCRKGWKPFIVWECETKQPGSLVDRIVNFLEGDSKS